MGWGRREEAGTAAGVWNIHRVDMRMEHPLRSPGRDQRQKAALLLLLLSGSVRGEVPDAGGVQVYVQVDHGGPV